MPDTERTSRQELVVPPRQSNLPVILGACVREALWDALGYFGLRSDLEIDLPLPSTPPHLIATLREISRQRREKETLEASR